MVRLGGTEKGKTQVNFFICTKPQALDNIM